MKREERIRKAIENPTKLSDYALLEGRESLRRKGTKRGYNYRWLIPGLVLFACAVAILISCLAL